MKCKLIHLTYNYFNHLLLGTNCFGASAWQLWLYSNTVRCILNILLACMPHSQLQALYIISVSCLEQNLLFLSAFLISNTMAIHVFGMHTSGEKKKASQQSIILFLLELYLTCFTGGVTEVASGLRGCWLFSFCACSCSLANFCFSSSVSDAFKRESTKLNSITTYYASDYIFFINSTIISEQKVDKHILIESI